MTDAKVIRAAAELPPRRQLRAALTREKLLEAARTVFARDGFEHARIEDIATLAGRTRGAFYDNFTDKEDVFFAIVEENMNRDLERLEPLLLGSGSRQQAIDALADYLAEMSKDRDRTLLNLEFKLYAIRHDVKRERLAQLYSSMCLRNCLPELNRMLSLLDAKGRSLQDRDCFAISGVVDGLALNHLFNPELLRQQSSAKLVKLCLMETMGEMRLTARVPGRRTAGSET